jgi:hypothetical protein
MSDENYLNIPNYNESALINNPIENDVNDNNNYDIDNNNNNNDVDNENYFNLQNQLMNNNEENFIEKFSSQEIYEILNDLVPSALYSLLIYYSFKESKNYCDPNIYLMLKTLLCIYLCYILNALFRTFLIYKNKMSNIFKFPYFLISGIITTSYFFSIFISYFIYTKNDSKCFVTDNFTIIVFYGLFFIGLVNIFQKLSNSVLIILWFKKIKDLFFADYSTFCSIYGIPPEIIRDFPTSKADKNHVGSCIICLEDINLDDDIMILNCEGKHFFHAPCIKHWLSSKTICPLCRSSNAISLDKK